MLLPMFVVIDRNPVNVSEIQNSCNARSQVMTQFNLVKSEADEDRYMAEIRSYASQQRKSGHLLYGTRVLTDLVKPWRNIWRTVCADSYFASITTVNKLKKIRLHFVGMVNMPPKKYPMHFLNLNYLHERC